MVAILTQNQSRALSNILLQYRALLADFSRSAEEPGWRAMLTTFLRDELDCDTSLFEGDAACGIAMSGSTPELSVAENLLTGLLDSFRAKWVCNSDNRWGSLLEVGLEAQFDDDGLCRLLNLSTSF